MTVLFSVITNPYVVILTTLAALLFDAVAR
jgi:hypothetical protein